MKIEAASKQSIVDIREERGDLVVYFLNSTLLRYSDEQHTRSQTCPSRLDVLRPELIVSVSLIRRRISSRNILGLPFDLTENCQLCNTVTG